MNLYQNRLDSLELSQWMQTRRLIIEWPSLDQTLIGPVQWASLKWSNG